MGNIHTFWYNKEKSKERIKKLKEYLLFYLANIHSANTDIFVDNFFSKEDAKTLKEFCKQEGYIKNESITDKGLLFLDILEKRSLLRKQFYFNVILTIATILMAVIAIINLIISKQN